MIPVNVHTIVLVSVLFALFSIAALYAARWEIKHGRRDVPPRIFLPFIGLIFYGMWFAIG
jgi:fumarate reductase subunit D